MNGTDEKRARKYIDNPLKMITQRQRKPQERPDRTSERAVARESHKIQLVVLIEELKERDRALDEL